MTPRPAPAAALGALLLLTAACSTRPAPAPAAAATYEGGGVQVAVRLETADGGSDGLIRATFTPQEPGFHLYSVDLPDGGVDGLGIPTRLTAGTGLAPDGSPTADRPLRTVSPDGLGVDLPVYPDGPVTLTLPVHRTGPGPGTVVVSYGACSEQRCLAPVTGRAITLG